MLVEFIGMPGSGKSAIVDALMQDAAGWQCIGMRARRAHAVLSLGLPALSQEDRVISALCSDRGSSLVRRWRRIALLRGDRRIAAARQRGDRVTVTDQLFVHTLFCTVGPLESPAPALLANLACLLDRTYAARRVVFVHVNPVASQWQRQLHGRPRSGSQFWGGGEKPLLDALAHDQLYWSGFIEPLKAMGFPVIEVVPDASVPIAAMAQRCRQCIEECLQSMRDR